MAPSGPSGSQGESPMPRQSMRKLATPRSANARAWSTNVRPGPTWQFAPVLRKSTIFGGSRRRSNAAGGTARPAATSRRRNRSPSPRRSLSAARFSQRTSPGGRRQGQKASGRLHRRRRAAAAAEWARAPKRKPRQDRAGRRQRPEPSAPPSGRRIGPIRPRRRSARAPGSFFARLRQGRWRRFGRRSRR